MEYNTSSHPPNTGITVSVRGSIVDVRFDASPPLILTWPRAHDAGGIIVTELRDQLDSVEKPSDEDRQSIIEQSRATLVSFQPKRAATADSES